MNESTLDENQMDNKKARCNIISVELKKNKKIMMCTSWEKT